MEKNSEFNKIIENTIKDCLLKYDLKDTKSINKFTDIAHKAVKDNEYNPESQLSKEIFIKNNIVDSIDKYMVKIASNDKTIYSIIENNLLNVLNITCKIGKKKFEKIEEKELEYYKEYAVLKAIETYDEKVKGSLNLYVNTWFMAFINKEVTEESDKVLVK